MRTGLHVPLYLFREASSAASVKAPPAQVVQLLNFNDIFVLTPTRVNRGVLKSALMTTVTFDEAEYFALEVDGTTGPFFLAIPVSNHLCDYTEWYELDQFTFEQYRLDLELALPFVQQCRDHLHDDLLLLKPGRIRGTPSWPKGRGPSK